MKYEARENKKGWHVFKIEDSGEEINIGFAPTDLEADKLVADNVLQETFRTIEYDATGKRTEKVGVK